MRYSILILLLALYLKPIAQTPCEEEKNPPFMAGEVLHYDLIYNWGFIWAHAGEVTFEVRDTIINSVPHFWFYSYGNSVKTWDWFYKVRATYQSYSDENLHPIYFNRKGIEGSHTYDNQYVVENGIAKMTSKDENGETKSKDILLSDCSYDVLSAIYFCRSLSFNDLKVNDLIDFDIFLDGEIFPSYIRYSGEATWIDPETLVSYDCYVFKPKLIEGTVFKKGENMTVYVTKNFRIPVYVETELVVGKAKVYLRSSSIEKIH